MGGPALVVREDRPVVREDVRLRRAQADHGLDRDAEARHQLGALAALAGDVVQQVGVHVHLGADAVAAVILDDPVLAAGRAGLAADVALDRPGDVHQAVAVPHGRDAGPHGLLGHPGELEQLRSVTGAHEGREGRVAVPAVHDGAGVDRDDVAVLQDRLLVRDAVDDDLVHRGADGGGEAAVPEEVRLGAVRGQHLAGGLVQVLGRGTRHGHLPGGRVDGGDDQPRLAHLRDLLRGLDLDHGECLPGCSVSTTARTNTTAAAPSRASRPWVAHSNHALSNQDGEQPRPRERRRFSRKKGRDAPGGIAAVYS